MPFGDAKTFLDETAKAPEGLVRLKRESGILAGSQTRRRRISSAATAKPLKDEEHAVLKGTFTELFQTAILCK